jgi:hypothetical protein
MWDVSMTVVLVGAHHGERGSQGGYRYFIYIYIERERERERLRERERGRERILTLCGALVVWPETSVSNFLVGS